MFFFKKKEEKSENSERVRDNTLEKRIDALDVRIKRAENDILGLATENEVIRNKVLRKIQFKRKDLEEEEKPEERPADGLPRAQDLNTLKPFGL